MSSEAAKPGGAEPPAPKPAPNPAPNPAQPTQTGGPVQAAKPAPKPAPKPISPKPISIVPKTPARDPGPARFRARHWIMAISFLLLAAIPGAAGVAYLHLYAADQYHSVIGFSVHSEEGNLPLTALGAITGAGGGAGASDPDILYEFIRSQQMVEEVNEELDLVAIFNRPENDPVFTLGENPTIEDLHGYWSWMVSVAYDSGTSLIEIEARAFAPEDAQAIARAIAKRSTELINALSDEAKQDAIAFAEQDLREAEARLREIRLQLREFRAEGQQIDPTADTEQVMGVVQALEGELAEMLIDRAVLIRRVGPEDSRITRLDERIEATEARIADERAKIGAGAGAGAGAGGATTPEAAQSAADLANAVGDYEELLMDREFAEQAYVAVLAAYTEAKAEARRKHRYLATHVGPTKAQQSLYPRRWLLSFALVFMLVVSWMVLVLMIFNVRDTR